MGIRIAESPATFHVPYGPLNSDGTPEASFVDLKTHPEWVPVIEPCLGWPETRELLQSINSPTSPLMSLAASQGFTSPGQPEFQVVLTSFVTLCYAEVAHNRREVVEALAALLEPRMSAFLQAASEDLERALFLNVLLDLQPTVFRLKAFDGWSLSVFLAAYGSDEGDARRIWRVGMRSLQEAISEVEY